MNICPYRLYAAKVKLEETFQIKSMDLRHNCESCTDNNKVTTEYIAERYLDEWTDAFSKVVPTTEIRYCSRHIWDNFKKAYPGQA